MCNSGERCQPVLAFPLDTVCTHLGPPKLPSLYRFFQPGGGGGGSFLFHWLAMEHNSAFLHPLPSPLHTHVRVQRGRGDAFWWSKPVDLSKGASPSPLPTGTSVEKDWGRGSFCSNGLRWSRRLPSPFPPLQPPPGGVSGSLVWRLLLCKLLPIW